MMSQQLLNPCPLHHRPFAAQPLHRITCSWRGKALPVQKSTAPRRSKGLTWTVYARRPSNPLEECVLVMSSWALVYACLFVIHLDIRI